MQREMMSMMDMEPGNPVRLLMLASTVRDEMPWLYEIISEAYRQELSGHHQKANQAKHQLMSAVRMMPLSRLSEDKGVYEIFHEIEYWLRRSEHISSPPPRARVSKSEKKDEPAA
jgi:hypothetical protein